MPVCVPPGSAPAGGTTKRTMIKSLQAPLPEKMLKHPHRSHIRQARQRCLKVLSKRVKTNAKQKTNKSNKNEQHHHTRTGKKEAAVTQASKQERKEESNQASNEGKTVAIKQKHKQARTQASKQNPTSAKFEKKHANNRKQPSKQCV